MSNRSSSILHAAVSILHAAVFLILAQFPAIAFQSGSQKIFIEPRTMPGVADRSIEGAAHLRVDASLVLISANASTDTGARVIDLQKETFPISEDGIERPITYFAMQDEPLSVGLLFDSSGSMHNKMRQSAHAAAEFFKTAS